MTSEDSAAAFAAFDFDADPRWEEYRLNITIPPGRDEASVMQRYKQKFYKLHIDSTFEVKAPAGASTARPSSSSASESPYESSSGFSGSSSSGPAPTRRGPTVYRSAPSGGAPQAPPNGGGGRAAPSGARGGGRFAHLFDGRTTLFLMHAVVLVMAALAMFPLSPAALAYRGFRWTIYFSLISSVFAIFTRYRLPRAFTLAALKDWGPPVLNAPEFINMMSCFVFLPSNRPISLAVVPHGIFALLNVATHLQQNFSRAQLFQTYFRQPCLWLQQNRAAVEAMSAGSEISLGFMLIFFMLTPARSVLQMVLFWQILKLKYHSPSSQWAHRQAWTAVEQRVGPYIDRFAPILRTPIGYAQRWFQSVGR
eukprot:TRINITY_DN1220_c1_g1_i1.p1 TRINITY_DN1220_c1_g1~~TRINITY_DN1220_c1_g1_i1.p1  ORF type:complete len:366 (-),score=71.58 TRINITY_DN1220_c1_g1_i1:1052-2149(-)